MNKYNRINLELTDLSPKSVSEVFLFLHNCLENDLSLEYYKNCISDYSISEQYFILHYAKQYFSDSYNSYLNRWMKKQVEEIGEEKAILDRFENIGKKADILLTFLNQTESTVKRQSKKIKKTGISITTKESIYEYRIPLYFKKHNDNRFTGLSSTEINMKSFKNKTKEIIVEVVGTDQFEEFFDNSFYFQNNLRKTQSLYIEMGRIQDVYYKFYELYMYYRKERNHQNRIVSEHYDELIKKSVARKESLSEIKKNFTRIPKIPSLDKVTRFDFMKIMYNTFPQIRESASEYLLKHPESNLDSYLKTKSRNLKSA